MNHDYRVLPAAEDDIFEIWRLIAEDNLEAAERVEAEIRGAFSELAQLPKKRHDLTSLICDFGVSGIIWSLMRRMKTRF